MNPKQARAAGRHLPSTLNPLLQELGRTDAARLRAIAALYADGDATEVPIAACLQALFPDKAEKAALQAFSALRKRVNDVSNAHGIGVTIAVDTAKHSSPSDRVCWIEGPDPTAANVGVFSRGGAQDVDDLPLVESLAWIIHARPGMAA